MDIIPIQSPTGSPEKKYAGATAAKPATVTVQLIVAKLSPTEGWPLGTLVRNSFPIPSQLRIF